MQPPVEEIPQEGGLMAGQPVPQEQAPEQGQDQGVEEIDDSLDNLEGATEEEQKQYDALIEPALGLVHGRENRDNVFNRMKKAENLGKEIGLIAESLMSMLESQIGGKKSQVLPAVRFEVVEEIVMELIEVANEAGLVGDDEKELGDLYSSGILTSSAKRGDESALAGGTDREEHKQRLQQIMADKGIQQTPGSALILDGIKAQSQQGQQGQQGQQA